MPYFLVCVWIANREICISFFFFFWDFTIQPWKTYPVILIITFNQCESSQQFRKGIMTMWCKHGKFNIHEGQMRSGQSKTHQITTHNSASFPILLMRKVLVSLHSLVNHLTKRKQNSQLRKIGKKRWILNKIERLDETCFYVWCQNVLHIILTSSHQYSNTRCTGKMASQNKKISSLRNF